MIGTHLAHYRILGKLGEGGMGDVFSAEDTTLGRKVALKVLHEEMAEDSERLMRFEREAKAIAALNHPNIVTIYSVEEADGKRFITMELVQGEPLARVILGNRLESDRFLRFAKPLIEALVSAHENGIVHRDLKPANIMVTDDGRIKVLDFGLAKLQSDSGISTVSQMATEARTQVGMVMGTMPYMSPEQVQGQPVDHRTDIFAVGVIFHEMLTGERPFSGASSAELVSAILRDPPPRLTELRPDLPGHLGRIVARCLEKDPARRYQTARDIGLELEAVEQERIATAPSETKTEAAPSIAVLPFADMSAEKDQDYFCEGLAEELINGLGRIEHLRVASRTSAFQFKDTSLDIRQIGQRLNVATVLEGSVRKAGDRLRVTAQLVDVKDGYRLWSERFDRELKDVFAIQDEIAESIVEALEMQLSPRERRAIQNVATRDVEAFDCYLRGRKFFYQMNRRSFEFARQMYSRAIEIDPNYALAFAGIADCSSFVFMYADSSEANRNQANEASRKALELDPELAEAHASRALALSISERYEEAEAEFEAAIERNPKLFEAYYFYARACLAQGKLQQAADLFRKASEVRPEDYQAPQLLTQVLEGMGAPAEVIAEADRKALELLEAHIQLNPDDARALYLCGSSVVKTGDKERGLRMARKALAIDPGEPAILYNVACTYATADEKDEAIDLLGRAIDAGFGYRAWLEHDSDFDELRDDPRFQALVERLG